MIPFFSLHIIIFFCKCIRPLLYNCVESMCHPDTVCSDVSHRHCCVNIAHVVVSLLTVLYCVGVRWV